MQKQINWSKVGAIALMGTVLVGGTLGAFAVNGNSNALDDINAKLDAIDAEDEVVVEAPVELSQLDSVQADVEAIKLDMFKDDAWEAEAEVLAIEEIEDDDYEALFDFMTSPTGMNLSIDDERDIESVIVKDVSVSGTDVDDKDAVVTYELKVYYENMDGDNKKAYLTVEADIEDGEVEDLDISETA